MRNRAFDVLVAFVAKAACRIVRPEFPPSFVECEPGIG